MKFPFIRWIGGLVLVLNAIVATQAADALVRREWSVDGVAREALVYVPAAATASPRPVVLAFHGHGGTMKAVAERWSYHTRWPEAVVVYPQGLPTPGLLSDPNGERPGWQSAPGKQGDRDLKFVDAILASLRTDYRIDDRRIYVTGHSNGGLFTYLLWAERGDQFAAFAPIAAIDAAVAGQSAGKLKPKPVFHVAGETDPLVKFEWQQRMIAAVRKVNHCGPAERRENGTVKYPSSVGAPVVTYIHPGGHAVPPAALPLVIAFFQECGAGAASH